MSFIFSALTVEFIVSFIFRIPQNSGIYSVLSNGGIGIVCLCVCVCVCVLRVTNHHLLKQCKSGEENWEGFATEKISAFAQWDGGQLRSTPSGSGNSWQNFLNGWGAFLEADKTDINLPALFRNFLVSTQFELFISPERPTYSEYIRVFIRSMSIEFVRIRVCGWER